MFYFDPKTVTENSYLVYEIKKIWLKLIDFVMSELRSYTDKFTQVKM